MNLFELFVKIGVKDEASGNLSKIAGNLGNGLKAAARVGVAAMSVAASGIAALTSAAVKNYAEYEQLIGGAELLFGEAFDFVAEKAANAYSTVQMSQSEYLQQVNGFSTGLKTALDGNAQAAAELADKILTAEADIVAATGTTQEAVQNAFNGIMKSNYTMLDNLQLGITPTKEGFQEMIDKVNEWNAANGKATKYQIDNLADAQSALIDYIAMQGLAGYASMEAAGTISGSFAMVKATWQNLITGVADKNANMESLIGNFVTAAGTAASNLIPVITQAIAGAGNLVTELAPIIATALPEMVNTVLPSLLTAAMALVEGFVNALVQMAPSLVTAAVSLVSQLVEFLINNLPMLIDSAIEIIMALIDGIVQFLPLLITAAVAIITELAVRLTDPGTLTQLVMSALAILSAVCQGIFQNLPVLLQAAIQIITQLVEFLISPDNLAMIIKEAATIVMALVTGLLDAGFKLVIAAGELVGTIVETILNTDWIAVGQSIVSSIAAGFGAAWDKFKSWVSGETNGLSPDTKDEKDKKTTPSGVTNNYNFYNSNLTAADVMREAQYNQSRAVMVN